MDEAFFRGNQNAIFGESREAGCCPGCAHKCAGRSVNLILNPLLPPYAGCCQRSHRQAAAGDGFCFVSCLLHYYHSTTFFLSVTTELLFVRVACFFSFSWGRPISWPWATEKRKQHPGKNSRYKHSKSDHELFCSAVSWGQKNSDSCSLLRRELRPRKGRSFKPRRTLSRQLRHLKKTPPLSFKRSNKINPKNDILSSCDSNTNQIDPGMQTLDWPCNNPWQWWDTLKTLSEVLRWSRCYTQIGR